ncbi:hypothetical protein PILCRDRAFT_420031 [Piloderma croceum F 1598]|uniref:Uncharacterized protein n=1 Tax=Piloderma croceum (strain F 1598) TaxID=765440 RepID=A0A0C3FWP8_PILCF|nr:hypothetical protein PILCRDRAFT_420031 [Piloderma croceum F 1598]
MVRVHGLVPFIGAKKEDVGRCFGMTTFIIYTLRTYLMTVARFRSILGCYVELPFFSQWIIIYLSLKTRSDDGRGSFDYPSRVILFGSIKPQTKKTAKLFLSE